MLMVAIALCGLVLVPLTGGSLRRLGTIAFVRSWLVFTGLGLQLVITTLLPNLPEAPSQVVHVVSYLFIFGFLVSNRHLPGLKVVTLGTSLNFLAIIANRGTMPARPGALRTAGIVLTHQFENSAPVRHAHLALLGDYFAVPASFPLANVFSVGDVLIDVGALILILTVCRRTPVSEDRSVETSPLLGSPAGPPSPRPVSCADGWLGLLRTPVAVPAQRS